MKNNQAFGLVFAAIKPSLKKEKTFGSNYL
jgi:hypothetical protein